MLLRQASIQEIAQYVESADDHALNRVTVIDGTPLHLAVYCNRSDVVRLLLTRGIDVDSKANAFDFPAVTALHLAAFFGRHEVVQLLIEAGARKDIVSGEGKTALMYAHGTRKSDIVALLQPE